MSDPGELVIDVTGVTKRFDGKTVVNGIDLQVRRGEIYGFLGPNGSGKTTFIRMLCGLLTPDGGSGKCLGHDLLTGQDLIKREVGYMTQSFSYYTDLSVRENLDFIARIYGISDRADAVRQSLERLGLQKRGDQLAGELSGGWKQRLALAACLIHKPLLLLLDEPTAGVDPKARREFWDEIHKLSTEGITSLITTHYMDEAERCHRIACLAYGNILVRGTVAEVIAFGQALDVVDHRTRARPACRHPPGPGRRRADRAVRQHAPRQRARRGGPRDDNRPASRPGPRERPHRVAPRGRVHRAHGPGQGQHAEGSPDAPLHASTASGPSSSRNSSRCGGTASRSR